MGDRPAASFVGIVPAAGSASRLGGAAKELLPLLLLPGVDGPRPVAEHTLRGFASAGVERAVVVTSPRRPEVLRVLGDGSRVGVSLAFVVQPQPTGLTAAVLTALPWLNGHSVCLGLPDTVYEPADAAAHVCAEVRQGADLALGLFPTDRPQELGPVRVDGDGRVLEVLEKPPHTDLANTWGVVAWSPAFTRFLVEAAQAQPGIHLGAVFDAAARSDLDVRAVELGGGRFMDVGTPAGLSELLHWQAERSGTLLAWEPGGSP